MMNDGRATETETEIHHAGCQYDCQFHRKPG